MRKALAKIIPEYAWLPTLICLAFDFFVFYATRPIASGFHHYNVSLPADDLIPFVPAFIVIYVLSFVQWALGFIVTGRESREFCHKVLSAEIVAKVICFVIFLVFPTVMTRPEITGSDIFSKFTAFIYSVDTPDNLFPSIHCFMSVYFAAVIVRSEKTGKAFKAANVVFAVLVCACVVLVKQHVLVDIAGGVILAFIAPFIAKLLHAEKIFSVFCGKNKQKETREVE